MLNIYVPLKDPYRPLYDEWIWLSMEYTIANAEASLIDSVNREAAQAALQDREERGIL